jgi:hypothetical protein
MQLSLTLRLSGKAPTVTVQVQQEPPAGPRPLQARVRPSAYGAARIHCARRSLRLGFGLFLSPPSLILTLRSVPTDPLAGTEERRRVASCGTDGPGRDWPGSRSSAHQDCLALFVLQPLHEDHD